MYTNCPHHPAPSLPPLEFKLPSFAPDEKLAFVDSVCGTLMKSRFGDGAMYTPNPRFRGTADEPFDYDYMVLLEEESVSLHDAAPLPGRTILGRAIAGGLLQKPARSKGVAFSDTTLGRNLRPCEIPANLGRGSPNKSATLFFASSLAA